MHWLHKLLSCLKLSVSNLNSNIKSGSPWSTCKNSEVGLEIISVMLSTSFLSCHKHFLYEYEDQNHLGKAFNPKYLMSALRMVAFHQILGLYEEFLLDSVIWVP